MLPETNRYIRIYDRQTQYMYFLNEDLLEKQKFVWDKVTADIKNAFDSEPVDNKFLKTEINFSNDEGADFYDEEIPKD